MMLISKKQAAPYFVRLSATILAVLLLAASPGAGSCFIQDTLGQIGVNPNNLTFFSFFVPQNGSYSASFQVTAIVPAGLQDQVAIVCKVFDPNASVRL